MCVSRILAPGILLWVLGPAFSYSELQSSSLLAKVNITCPQPSAENNFTSFLYNPADGKCHPRETRATCSETKKLVFDSDLTSEYREKYNEELRFGKCDCLTEKELYSPGFDKCYKEGDAGDCPNGLVIVQDLYEAQKYKEEHKLQGFIPLGFCGCKEALTQYPCRNFPFLYSEKSNQCFEMYTQGPCGADEWLTPATPVDFTRRLRHPGVCTKNLCKHGMPTNSSSNPYHHMYEHNGSCYHTATQGHCADPDQVSYFEYNYPLPECGDYDTVFGGCHEAACSTNSSTLYHASSKSCHTEGTQGPCRDTMVLTRLDDDSQDKYLKQFGTSIAFGKCDCQSSTPVGSCSGRPYVFSSTLQQCVPAYSQGPCLESEWMIPEPSRCPYGTKCSKSKDRLRRGLCVPNPCLKNRPVYANVTVDEVRFFYYGSPFQCYLTGTQGHCPEAGNVAYFNEDSFDPQCTSADWAYAKRGTFSSECQKFVPYAGTVGSSLGCPAGYRKRQQDCVRSSNF